MVDKFQNKYRITSARMQNWDYGWNAHYFVTICTKAREYFFGDITDGKMQLSEAGKIVEMEWMKTPEIRPDMNLQLGAFVIMPNHFHAIIYLGENEYNEHGAMQCRDAMHRVSTAQPTGPAKITKYTESKGSPDKQNKFSPQSKNLASIIRGFKSAVTIKARKIDDNFAWQSRFHDHIIRNNESYQKIETYIHENPMKWELDRFYNE